MRVPAPTATAPRLDSLPRISRTRRVFPFSWRSYVVSPFLNARAIHSVALRSNATVRRNPRIRMKLDSVMLSNSASHHNLQPQCRIIHIM